MNERRERILQALADNPDGINSSILARAVGVAPGTITSWKKNGILKEMLESDDIYYEDFLFYTGEVG